MAPKQRSTGVPAAPLPPLAIDPSALLSDAISFTGAYPITIGANTVLHPRCKLNSLEGPIIIGSNCIISEKAQIIAPDANGLVAGESVLIEVNSIVRAARIGDGTSVEVGTKLGKGSRVGTNCTLSPLSIIQDGQDVPDGTVVYAENQQRLDTSNSYITRSEVMAAQIQCLKKLLPNKTEKYTR